MRKTYLYDEVVSVKLRKESFNSMQTMLRIHFFHDSFRRAIKFIMILKNHYMKIIPFTKFSTADNFQLSDRDFMDPLSISSQVCVDCSPFFLLPLTSYCFFLKLSSFISRLSSIYDCIWKSTIRTTIFYKPNIWNKDEIYRAKRKEPFIVVLEPSVQLFCQKKASQKRTGSKKPICLLTGT